MTRCSYHNGRLIICFLFVSTVMLLAINRYLDRDKIQQGLSIIARQSSVTNLFKGYRKWNVAPEDLQTGYVLTLGFTGQLVAGLRGLMSMQCWMGSFGLQMSIVEPYVVNSKLINGMSVWRRLQGDDEPVKDAELLMLEDYFNMNTFNYNSQRNGRPLLTSWETFWDNAPRKLIVVTVRNPFQQHCLSYTKAEMCEADPKRTTHHGDERDQFVSGCSPSENVTTSVGYLINRGFKVVKSVCLNCDSKGSQYFTPTELTRLIFGDNDPSQVTLVISQWKFSFEMTPNCGHCNKQTIVEGNPLAQFSPSPLLVEHADAYIKSLRADPHTKLVAIMIRIEWFLIMHRRSSLETVRECLTKVLSEYKKYLAGLGEPFVRTVLATDIGKYGSGTFQTTLAKNDISQNYFSQVVQEIKEFVKKVNLDYQEWEESFEAVTGRGVYDRGYIGLLQSVIVSKADYVIRMGGGHYQQLALQLFLKNHNHPALSHQNDFVDVCIKQKMR